MQDKHRGQVADKKLKLTGLLSSSSRVAFNPCSAFQAARSHHPTNSVFFNPLLHYNTQPLPGLKSVYLLFVGSGTYLRHLFHPLGEP